VKFDPNNLIEPEHLLAYDSADWPNPECHPECAFWAAREAWREAHPPDLSLIGDPRQLVADGPDVPFHPREMGGGLIDAAHNQVI
jgi:hypothetical protein